MSIRFIRCYVHSNNFCIDYGKIAEVKKEQQWFVIYGASV